MSFDGHGRPGVSIELSCSYLKSSPVGATVTANAKVVKLAGRAGLAFTECEFVDSVRI
jgi:acyl-coenzyme A thioesterase PaaI-like protein